MKKALVLLSGGLDSMLACKILIDQGVAVTGLTFTTPFFGAKKAEKVSKQLGISLKVVDIAKKHFKIVKNPPHGHGKNVNPCIDCHGLMFRKAGELIKKEGYDFVATGEVLGQRPMSQNKKSLRIVEELAGLENEILRPLSAKLLPETEIEKQGLIDRNKLLAIKGKSRKEQMALAKKLGFKSYATPGGGCLLTDPGYSKRFKELQEVFPDFGLEEASLIKYGRLFVEQDYMFLVGRKHEENLELKKITGKDDILLEVQEIPGPLTLLHFFRVAKQPVSEEVKQIALKKAAEKTVRYANQEVKELEKVEVRSLDGKEKIKIKQQSEKENTENIENSDLDIQEKVELLLVLQGLKPATEIAIYSEEWKKGKGEKEIALQDLKTVEDLIQKLGLYWRALEGKIVDSIIADRKSGEFNKRKEVNFLVAGSNQSLELLEKAYQDEDMKLFGKAYGFPDSAIEAACGGGEMVSQNKLLDQGVDKEVIAFARFGLSRNNWKEEIKTAGKWAKAVKSASPKIYAEFMEVMKSAIEGRVLYLER